MKRYEGFLGRIASGVTVGLILAVAAATQFWEQLRTFAAATLGVISAPTALPLVMVVALPFLGAAVLVWHLA